MTTILAIDQSYTDTGLAVVEDGKPVYWQSLKPKGSRAEKRAYIQEAIRFRGLDTTLDLIVIEGLWSPPGISLSTCLIDFAFDIGKPIHALNPRTWKMKMLGSANADKDAAILVAQEITGTTFSNHNIADAICIGMCAHRHPQLLKKPE